MAEYHGKLNSYVIFVSLIAASGGLLFGYDLGVTGKLMMVMRKRCYLAESTNIFFSHGMELPSICRRRRFHFSLTFSPP